MSRDVRSDEELLRDSIEGDIELLGDRLVEAIDELGNKLFLAIRQYPIEPADRIKAAESLLKYTDHMVVRIEEDKP